MGSVIAGQRPAASQFNITSARYHSTDTTTVVFGNTEVIMAWSVADRTSADVTASGTNNTTFTLNRSGIWLIEFQTRITYLATPTIGDLFAYAYLVAGVIQFCGKTVPTPITLAALPGGYSVRAFNAGDQIQVRVRNLTNQTVHISTGDELSHITFTWLQGLSWAP